MADAIKPVRGNFRTTHYRPLQPGNRLSADGGREIHGSFRFACHWGSFSPAAGGPFSTQSNYEEIMLLKDKKCLIFGVANNRSIAYGIASCFKEHGARL